ncbi:hypothetical protein CN373_00280 [Bacillus cereus]|nr:hypothetical protein CN373_00280 [Bacillus cereus]
MPLLVWEKTKKGWFYMMKDVILKKKDARKERSDEPKEAFLKNEVLAAYYNYEPPHNTKYHLHIGPTNAGKTHAALARLKEANTGVYLAPLRLLALEVYELLNAEGIPCNLQTGEEERIVTEAFHLSCTVEMLQTNREYDVIVVDEAQMITDRDRGFAWYRAIMKSRAREVHVVASIDAKPLLLHLLVEQEVIIHEYERLTPLKIEEKRFSMKKVEIGDALIVFSKNRVLQSAAQLKMLHKSVSVIYGSMPPEARQQQVERFQRGETTVLVATDAIGMGLNLPIQRIVFLESEKFDGKMRRLLTGQEVKQIAGRAGRKGMYDVGKVLFCQRRRQMKKLLRTSDIPHERFTISPTRELLERFTRYSCDMGQFFRLWKEFEAPVGTQKVTLIQEKQLYGLIKGSEIEQRMSLPDLYEVLHLPFAAHERGLVKQWRATLYAIVRKEEWPEPMQKTSSLDEMELSYKSMGLHVIFLYRSNQRTLAQIWERERTIMAERIDEYLRKHLIKHRKKCKSCQTHMPWDYPHNMCQRCYEKQLLSYDYEEDYW